MMIGGKSPHPTPTTHTWQDKCCLFQLFSCQSSYSYDSGDINHTLHELTAGLHYTSDSDWDLTEEINHQDHSHQRSMGICFYWAARHRSHLGFFCGIFYGNNFMHNYDFINRRNQTLSVCSNLKIWVEKTPVNHEISCHSRGPCNFDIVMHALSCDVKCFSLTALLLWWFNWCWLTVWLTVLGSEKHCSENKTQLLFSVRKHTHKLDFGEKNRCN